MRKIAVVVCAVFVGMQAAASATAQEIVHALSGKAVSIDAQAKTLQIKTNDGSEGDFQFPPTKSQEMSFDREVQGRTTPLSAFNKVGDDVVVFYYGNGGVRTAVAVQDLGSGPLTTIEGTVTAFNRHQQTLSVKQDTGKTQSFKIDPKAMADSPMGAVAADRFAPQKGDHVRVIAKVQDSGQTALFIRD